ncbi:hypothetical protein [Deinococcus hopiensis]|uniref:Uncharacterized protein n=1 Tax=Deinococcus hopiensis KR-140 TaxID=695939 RepID=A0A1W1UWT4_9DEIO|nr:hypothetical protein [Deinococcus hopiensis]SMB85608.1 hypothetical protein SAMN00790413_03470 [Deinococcus hopiensis KR-140]
MEFFVPDTHLTRIKHTPDGQTELTMLLEVGRPQVGDLLISSADTWKVTKLVPRVGELRALVRKTHNSRWR